MKMSLLFLLVFLLALASGGEILIAQSVYRFDDPRWTDADTTNDPNICFEGGSNCRSDEDWKRGWCEARARAGFPPCGSQSSVSRQSSWSSSSSRQSSSSSSSQQRSTSTSGSVRTSSQTQASAPQSPSIRRGRYRLGYDCPYGKVCVGHWPSGDIEVYDLDNCCWDPDQAIERFNVYE